MPGTSCRVKSVSWASTSTDGSATRSPPRTSTARRSERGSDGRKMASVVEPAGHWLIGGRHSRWMWLSTLAIGLPAARSASSAAGSKGRPGGLSTPSTVLQRPLHQCPFGHRQPVEHGRCQPGGHRWPQRAVDEGGEVGRARRRRLVEEIVEVGGGVLQLGGHRAGRAEQRGRAVPARRSRRRPRQAAAPRTPARRRAGGRPERRPARTGRGSCPGRRTAPPGRPARRWRRRRGRTRGPCRGRCRRCAGSG